MFERKTRDNGETFYVLADNAAEWLAAAVREAHQGDLPNDWVYEECAAAYDSIDGLDEDGMGEHADSRVDIYTKQLYQWAADMVGTTVYAEAEDEAQGMTEDAGNVEQHLQAIQYCAIRTIAQAILDAYQAREDEDEDAAQ